jgi:hypothetical protein
MEETTTTDKEKFNVVSWVTQNSVMMKKYW